MKATMLLATLFSLGGAHAAVLTWPGPTPCDGTLQACIDSAAPSDIVRIASETVDESPFIAKAMTLEAAPGYLPRFAAGRTVTINFIQPGSQRTVIRGLLFERGQIWSFQNDGNAELVVEGNRFESTDNGVTAIYVLTDPGAVSTEYTVRHNWINYTYDGIAQPRGAVRVRDFSPGNSLNGEIAGNTIHAMGNSGQGIAIYSGDSSTHQVDIFGNTIHGADQTGIEVTNGADGGTILARIYSNLVHDTPGTGIDGDAISLWSFGDTIQGQVINNSLIGHSYGLTVRAGSSGATEATVANNLIARNGAAWFVASSTTFSEHHNLFHANNDEPDSIDPTSAIADPLLDATLPGRLRDGSPAIDAGSTAATSTLPALDARGNRRYIGGSVDIGAFEFGDQWLLARDPEGDNNNFAIDDPSLNGQPGLVPQITAVWNPHGPGVGVYNDGNEGLYYASSRWQVFNEGVLSDPILPDSSFAIFTPGSNVQVGTHNNSTAAATTTIDWPASNNHPQRILAVSQHWNRDGIGTYNDHPIGILYASGKWRIANLDIADIPAGADFNLFTQDPSQNAFEHIARGANRTNNWTVIHHPLLDGNPCARMQVTQSVSQGVFNAHPIGVFYTGTNWAVFNQDQETMPENAAFHVIVDGDSLGCELFSDRFEPAGAF